MEERLEPANELHALGEAKATEVAEAAEGDEPPKEPAVSAVTFNAVKHGIFSVSPVIPWFEDEEDWYAFRDSIFESLQPEGGLEQALVDRVAVLHWRLMRIVRYERESVTSDLREVGKDLKLAKWYAKEEMPRELTPEIRDQMDRMAMRRLVPDERTLNKIMRYEGRLQRHLMQLNQLSRLQAGRRGRGDPTDRDDHERRATLGLGRLIPPRL